MTVRASSADGATTPIRQLRPAISVRKKETPGSAAGSLTVSVVRRASLPVETRIVSSPSRAAPPGPRSWNLQTRRR